MLILFANTWIVYVSWSIVRKLAQKWCQSIIVTDKTLEISSVISNYIQKTLSHRIKI